METRRQKINLISDIGLRYNLPIEVVNKIELLSRCQNRELISEIRQLRHYVIVITDFIIDLVKTNETSITNFDLFLDKLITWDYIHANYTRYFFIINLVTSELKQMGMNLD